MEKKKNTPKLRFPEFTGEWEEKKLGEIVNINQGLQIAISQRYTEQVEDSYFYITNEFLKENSTNKYYIKNPPKSVQCNKNDILMTRTGNTGRVVTNVEGAFHNNFFKITYPEYIDKNFLFYFLTLEQTQNEIMKMAGTSTIPDLNHSDFYRIKMSYLSLPEQTKIATFLTAVDEKLTQLKKKKTLLKQYKKGVMQKLFSQQLRFKDDNNQDFPDWQEKTLGEISKITNGNGDVQDASLEAKDGWYPFYDRSEIVKYLDRYTFDGEAIIYPGEGQSFFPRYFNGKYGLHQRCYTIKDYCANIHGKYLYYYLSTQNNYFIAFAVGSTVPSLRLDTFQQAKVLLPSLVEQQKIATFLSAIDEKISHSSAQIEKMEAWKKGLLQQMFC